MGLTQAFGIPWRYDGLAADSHLFDYEKDIIQHYQDAERPFPDGIRAVEKDDSDPDKRIAIYQRWLEGCPEKWPDVPRFIPPPPDPDEDPKARENPLIVKFGLREGLKNLPGWRLLRVVTNEPRWQLPAIPPSCSNVIIG